jgi:hypothetical protein
MLSLRNLLKTREIFTPITEKVLLEAVKSVRRLLDKGMLT